MILLLLAGCLGYTEGQAQRGELHCAWLDTCGELDSVGFSDVAACADAAAAQPYDDADCPDYDGAAMAACLQSYEDAIDAASCDVDFAEACLVCG